MDGEKNIAAKGGPSGLAGSATSPEWGGFHAGKARAKRRPTKWGAGREAGLRGFPHFPHRFPHAC